MIRMSAFAVGFALALSSQAAAHGAYDWINKGGYRNSNGDQCCGKDDGFSSR